MTVFKDIEFNHIQVWGGGRGGGRCAQKGFFSFSPVASIEVGIGPQNFLLLVSTLLTHLCTIARSYLVPVLNY